MAKRTVRDDNVCEHDKLMEGLGRVMLCLNGACVDADNILFYDSPIEPVKPLTMALLQIAIRAESGLPWFKSEKEKIHEQG